MLDHVIVTVSNFTRSIAFYGQALKPLGITDISDYKGQDGHPDLKGFGNDGRFFFWLKEGRPDPETVHFGFVAKSHAEVDAFTNCRSSRPASSRNITSTSRSIRDFGPPPVCSRVGINGVTSPVRAKPVAAW
jgi:catechol 2,3-dioxygenase-like lactoylglutathione lyase family enzyme